MKKTSPSFMASIAGAAVLAVACVSANAAIYQQPFDTPGSLPPDWHVAGYLNEEHGSVSVTTINGITGLQQERTQNSGGAAGNSWAYYQGSVDDVTGGVFSDFSASAIVRIGAAGLTAANGFMVRAQAPVGTSHVLSGYYVTFSRNSGLAIYKDPGAAGGEGSDAGAKGLLLASAPLSANLSTNVDYLFKVQAEGNIILGNLYAWSDDTESFSSLLGSISLEDNSYAAGIFGFRTTFAAGPNSLMWRDLKLESIPEPSALAVLLPVGLAFLLKRKMQR